ncbi:copper resistance protein B [Sphingomonas xinjiangensis]|uniref:Copper resistance protein B n=1 Tax=Sphingomonas xinjiangensis TaxID=643568 RepID=A0A840YSE1_9SPHN|nr:copper resistance protein B [Sphingomonas xinjiangensis]MBB5712609.1 copper resistance protein B [Sphingomonas xinjiangensis]
MKALILAGASASLFAASASAQTMDHSMHGTSMPGMQMPAKPAPKKAQSKPAAKKPVTKARSKPRPAADPHASHRIGATPAAAAAADPHAGHDMSGSQGANAHAGHDMQAPAAAPPQDPHAGHDMSAMPGMDMGGEHAGHDMGAMQANRQPKAGTDLPAGDAPAPAPQPGLAAARYWGADAMAHADHHLRQHHGGMTYRQVLFNLAEYQARKGGDGYHWDGEAWIGGDINRFTFKSEGEGTFGQALDSAEVQALYSRALDPYWNLQAGVRYDVKPNPSRVYATVGVEGLAPYWFDVEGAVFVSNKGEVLGRAEAWYDQRITQYLVLQPRVEANLSAQDVRDTGTGSGLTDLELGLRLRYEKSREFAPYVGVSWEREFGDTARFSRARGEGTGGFSFVAGVRTWF